MKFNQSGFTKKELLIVLGTITIMCLASLPLYYKLHKNIHSKHIHNKIERVNTIHVTK
ncbi:MAG TPA: type II secretion system protein [bacterium]|nr:type II secretion system protein [bacterium]